MKLINEIKLSMKGFSFFCVPTIFFLLISVCTGSMAVQEYWEMKQQKMEPCTIMVFHENLSSEDLVRIAEIDGIKRASLIYEVPVTVQVDGRSKELTLLGISADYLQDAYVAGGIFPEDTEMPYLVMNEAAYRIFSDEEEIDGETAGADLGQAGEQSIDSVVLDEGTGRDFVVDGYEEDGQWEKMAYITWAGKKLTGRLCGVLRGDTGEEPKAYISLDVAKTMLLKAGMEVQASGIQAVMQNAGVQEEVLQGLSGYGYQTKGIDSEQVDLWQHMQLRIQGYLWAAGIALCAYFALWSQKIKLDKVMNQTIYEEIQEKFIMNANVRIQLNRLRFFFMTGLGTLIGGLLYVFAELCSI